MRLPLAAVLPALALTLALAPDGAGEAPPHLGAAIAEQRNLVSARPSDAGVWNDLGNLLVMSGNLDEADGAYGRALELDPGSVQARFNLGLLRQQRGDLDGAISEYRELLELEPGHARALYQLGAAYEAQGQRELALERYAAAFTLDPELLFAESNPHIIENRLVTEALLLARRGSRSGPPTPRSYDEEARINSILAPPAPELEGEPPPGEDAEAANSKAGSDAASAAGVRDQIGRGAGAPRPRPAAGHRHRRLGQGPGARLERSARERAQPGARRRRRRRRAGGTQLATPIGGDGHTAGRTPSAVVATARR